MQALASSQPQSIIPYARSNDNSPLYILIDEKEDGYSVAQVSKYSDRNRLNLELPFALSLDDQMVASNVLWDLDAEEDLGDLKDAIAEALLALYDKDVDTPDGLLEGGETISWDVADTMLRSSLYD